jgi:hypothetical protein
VSLSRKHRTYQGRSKWLDLNAQFMDASMSTMPEECAEHITEPGCEKTQVQLKSTHQQSD